MYYENLISLDLTIIFLIRLNSQKKKKLNSELTLILLEKKQNNFISQCTNHILCLIVGIQQSWRI